MMPGTREAFHRPRMHSCPTNLVSTAHTFCDSSSLRVETAIDSSISSISASIPRLHPKPPTTANAVPKLVYLIFHATPFII